MKLLARSLLDSLRRIRNLPIERPRAGRILSNVAFLAIARAAQLVVGLTVSVYVTRHLGPANAGLLAYALSFAGMFASLAGLGLDTILVRELARVGSDGPARELLLGTAFWLRAAATPITAALIFAAAAAIADEPEARTLILIVAGGLVFQPFSVIDLDYQSRVESKFVVYVRLGTLLVTSLLRVALVLIEAPLWGFAAVAIVDAAISATGLVIVFVRHHRRLFAFALDRPLAARLLRDAWPLTVTAFLTSVYLNFDRVLVKEVLGDAEAGKFAVVVSFVTAIYFVPTSLGQSAFPSLVEARQDRARFDRRMQQGFDVMFWSAMAITLPTCLLAERLMQQLLGRAFEGAGEALAIAIWSVVVTFVGVVASYWLLVENLQHLYLIRLTASLATSLAVNLLLLPVWGIRGAAIAMVAGQLVASVVFFAIHPKTRSLPLMQLRALALPVRLWKARKTAAIWPP